jgi:chemotaxis signal transduction protein
MSKKSRISYREWLARDAAPPSPAAEPPPAPPVPEAAVEPPPAPVAQAVPEAAPVTAAEPHPGPALEPAAAAAFEYLVFRVGRELFALPLDAVDEAVDIDGIQRVPEMGAAMLGVISLRDVLVPVYGSAAVLGSAADAHRTALVFVTPRGRIALAVDDVDDVLSLPPDAVGRPPVDFGDALLVGVARRGTDLVGVLDTDILIAACRAEPALESA